MQHLRKANLCGHILQCLRNGQESRLAAPVQTFLQSQHSINTSSTCNVYHSKWVMPYFMEMKIRHDKMVKKGTAPIDRRSKYIEWNLDAEFRAFSIRLNEKIEPELLMLALLDSSHVLHQEQQQKELGLTSIDKAHGVRQQSEESNKELAKDGHLLIEQHCSDFVKEAWPSLPLDGVVSLVNYLTSDDVMSQVAQSIGIKDLVFAEPYPPSPAVMAQAARAVVAALAHSSDQRRTAAFVVDFVCTNLTGKLVWDMWEISHPVSMLQSILSRSGETAEPRLVHQAGCNTIEASYQVAFYDSGKTFLGAGYGESVQIATDEAARNALAKLFGDTSSRAALPFKPSLPPSHSNVPHSSHVEESNQPLDSWTMENADTRAPNVVVC